MSQKIKVYLVKPKLEPMHEILKYFDLYSNRRESTPDNDVHHLLVPERFILGEYDQINNNYFSLNNKRINFDETERGLRQYEEALKLGTLKIVKGLELSEETVLEITKKGRDYMQAKGHFIERTNNLIGEILSYR